MLVHVDPGLFRVPSETQFIHNYIAATQRGSVNVFKRRYMIDRLLGGEAIKAKRAQHKIGALRRLPCASTEDSE